MESILQQMLQQQLQNQQQMNSVLSALRGHQGGMSPPGVSFGTGGLLPSMVGSGMGTVDAGVGGGASAGLGAGMPGLMAAPTPPPQDRALPAGAMVQPITPATAGPPLQPAAGGPPRTAVPAGPLPQGQDGRLSSSYRYLGMQWKYNPRCVVPRKLKIAAIIWARPGQWAVIDLATACDDMIDELMFVVTSWRPSIRVKDLGAPSKSALCELAKHDAARVFRTFPTRYEGLAHDLANVTMHAHKLGLPLEDITPSRRHLIKGAAPAPEASTFGGAAGGGGGVGGLPVGGRGEAPGTTGEEPPLRRARVGEQTVVSRAFGVGACVQALDNELPGFADEALDRAPAPTGISLEELAHQAMEAASNSARLQAELDGATAATSREINGGNFRKRCIPQIAQPNTGSDGNRG